MSMNRVTWTTAFLGLLGIDVYIAFVKKGDGTWSMAFRDTFKTNTTAGKIVWVICYCIFSAWFIPHIMNYPEVKEFLDAIS